MAYDRSKPWIRRVTSGVSGIILAITALMFIALNVYRMNDALPVGSEVNNFEVVNIDGTVKNIRDFERPVVILFYQHGAIFSNMMYNATYKKFLAQYKFLQDKEIVDVVILVKGYSDYKELNELLDDKRIIPAKSMLYASDTKAIAKQFGVRSWPHLFVINESGIVIYESKLASPEYIQEMLWRN